MTLTDLRGPIAFGGLVVLPAPEGEGLAPLLADAVAAWRTPDPGWVAADGVPNEGTGGATFDLTVATEAATLALTNASTVPDPENRVTPTLVSGPAGLSIPISGHFSSTDNVGADYGLFTEAAFDLSGSSTFAIDFTPNNIGTTFTYFARQGSPFGSDGWHIEEADASGGFISYIGDAAAFSFTPPFTVLGAGVQTATMISGRQQFVFVVDRDTDTYRYYRNSVALPPAISDISTMGDATAALPLVFGANFILHNAVFDTRAWTAAEATTGLAAAWGV
jgi:hypothetical protein